MFFLFSFEGPNSLEWPDSILTNTTCISIGKSHIPSLAPGDSPIIFDFPCALNLSYQGNRMIEPFATLVKHSPSVACPICGIDKDRNGSF